ncbi:MAG: four helix bundle protein [Chloracidobacterium sp.]|nr:four helix bundle protein [Chloracidobacterium sp.]
MSGKIESYEDLAVWKAAMECAKLIYTITSSGPFGQDYLLRDQTRRAGVSIFSNIAEGFERDGNKEFCKILTIAKGSCGEARAQAIFAFELGYISKAQFDELSGRLTETNRQLSAFRSYLSRSELRGRKFA